MPDFDFVTPSGKQVTVSGAGNRSEAERWFKLQYGIKDPPTAADLETEAGRKEAERVSQYGTPATQLGRGGLQGLLLDPVEGIAEKVTGQDIPQGLSDYRSKVEATPLGIAGRYGGIAAGGLLPGEMGVPGMAGRAISAAGRLGDRALEAVNEFEAARGIGQPPTQLPKAMRTNVSPSLQELRDIATGRKARTVEGPGGPLEAGALARAQTGTAEIVSRAPQLERTQEGGVRIAAEDLVKAQAAANILARGGSAEEAARAGGIDPTAFKAGLDWFNEKMKNPAFSSMIRGALQAAAQPTSDDPNASQSGEAIEQTLVGAMLGAGAGRTIGAGSMLKYAYHHPYQMAGLGIGGLFGGASHFLGAEHFGIMGGMLAASAALHAVPKAATGAVTGLAGRIVPDISAATAEKALHQQEGISP